MNKEHSIVFLCLLGAFGVILLVTYSEQNIPLTIKFAIKDLINEKPNVDQSNSGKVTAYGHVAQTTVVQLQTTHTQSLTPVVTTAEATSTSTSTSPTTSISPTTASATTLSSTDSFLTIYFYATYPGPQNTMISTVVTNCTNATSLLMANGTKYQLDQMSDPCLEHSCTLTGYYATLINDSKLPLSLFSSAPTASGQVHLLTACVSPLMWYVDWTNFIEFFELWAQAGMTRLHVYWQTVSHEAFTILKLYESTGSVVLHEWPLLAGNLSEELMIYGQLFTYHDCLLRNRPDAKFTAFMDLDEIISVHNTSMNFTSYLQSIPEKVAAMNFESRFAYPKWDRSRTEMRLRDYSLNYLKSVQIENVTRVLHKHIVRPQHVSRMQVHYVITTEPAFIHQNPSVNDMFLVHLRKPIRPDSSSFNTSAYEYLNPVIDRAEAAWRRRLTELGAEADKMWPMEALKLFQKLDECNLKLFGSPTCWSFVKCRWMYDLKVVNFTYAPEDTMKWETVEAMPRH